MCDKARVFELVILLTHTSPYNGNNINIFRGFERLMRRGLKQKTILSHTGLDSDNLVRARQYELIIPTNVGVGRILLGLLNLSVRVYIIKKVP